MSLNCAYNACISFLGSQGIDKLLSISLDLALKQNNNYSICFFKIELSDKFIFVKVTYTNFIQCEFYK